MSSSWSRKQIALRLKITWHNKISSMPTHYIDVHSSMKKVGQLHIFLHSWGPEGAVHFHGAFVWVPQRVGYHVISMPPCLTLEGGSIGRAEDENGVTEIVQWWSHNALVHPTLFSHVKNIIQRRRLIFNIVDVWKIELSMLVINIVKWGGWIHEKGAQKRNDERGLKCHCRCVEVPVARPRLHGSCRWFPPTTNRHSSGMPYVFRIEVDATATVRTEVLVLIVCTISQWKYKTYRMNLVGVDQTLFVSSTQHFIHAPFWLEQTALMGWLLFTMSFNKEWNEKECTVSSHRLHQLRQSV